MHLIDWKICEVASQYYEKQVARRISLLPKPLHSYYKQKLRIVSIYGTDNTNYTKWNAFRLVGITENPNELKIYKAESSVLSNKIRPNVHFGECLGRVVNLADVASNSGKYAIVACCKIPSDKRVLNKVNFEDTGDMVKHATKTGSLDFTSETASDVDALIVVRL